MRFDAETEITKAELDALALAEKFSDGPYVETQAVCGGGYRDVVYAPYKRAYGTLGLGTAARFVWAWLSGPNMKKAADPLRLADSPPRPVGPGEGGIQADG